MKYVPQITEEDLCRSHLLCYATGQFPGYQIAKHHQMIAGYLEAIEKREINRLLITLPPRHGKCVHPKCDILMANGTKEFARRIRAGDKVIGYRNGKRVELEVVATEVSEFKNIVTIETESGRSLTVSHDHPVMVEGGKYRKAQDLTRKHSLCCIVNYPVEPKPISEDEIDTVIKVIDAIKRKKDKNQKLIHMYRVTGRLGLKWLRKNFNLPTTIFTSRTAARQTFPYSFLTATEKQKWQLLRRLICTNSYANKETVIFFANHKYTAQGYVTFLWSLHIKSRIEYCDYGFLRDRWKIIVHPGSVERILRFAFDGAKGEELEYLKAFKKLPGGDPPDLRLFNDFAYDPVKNVVPGPPMRLIHIQTTGPQNFIADDFVVHNTMLASEFFPAWYLGRNPDHEVMFATYSQDRAHDTGLKVRHQMESDAFRAAFTTKLRSDSKSKAHLTTTDGGALYSVGVGGAITGRGANLFLMDDLVKSREDAESPSGRNRIIEWFRGTAYTRLMKNGVIILIMCIAEGERILMADGTHKPVEEVKPGDMVYSFDKENSSFVKKKVTKASCSGVDDTLTIRTAWHSLRVNGRHPILVQREHKSEWIQAQHLNVGDMAKTSDAGDYEIREIVKSPPCRVYDLTVEDTESFVAEGIIVHNTRWHTQDLAGVILQDYGKDWVHLDLPAIADEGDILGRAPGEALWPEMFPIETLQEIRRVIGTREFNSQYQQRPVGAEGSIIKLQWFKRYVEKPRVDRIIQSWDTAYDSKSINDPSACTVWGEDVKEGKIYLLDVLVQRMEYPMVKQAVKAMYERYPSTSHIVIENRTSGKSIVKDLQRTTLPITPVIDPGDKMVRLMAVSGTIEAGNVYLPESAPWLFDYETELCNFPLGKHDDQVDSTSQGLTFLTRPRRVAASGPLYWK